MNPKILLKFIIRIFLLGGTINTYAQFYIADDYSESTSKSFNLSKSEIVLAFENSPFPTSSNSIRVFLNKDFFQKFLFEGERLEVNSKTWGEAEKGSFLIPEWLHNERPSLIKNIPFPDPFTFSIDCKGAILTKTSGLLFWRLLNSQYLYLTDGEGALLIRLKHSVLVLPPNRFPETNAAWKTNNLKYIKKIPKWMRDVSSCFKADILIIQKIFNNGIFLPCPLSEEVKAGYLTPELLKKVNVNTPKKLREELSKAAYLLAGRSDLELPSGVAVTKDNKIIFWKSIPKSKVLYIRSLNFCGFLTMR